MWLFWFIGYLKRHGSGGEVCVLKEHMGKTHKLRMSPLPALVHLLCPLHREGKVRCRKEKSWG